jgi:hypothetical protein
VVFSFLVVLSVALLVLKLADNMEFVEVECLQLLWKIKLKNDKIMSYVWFFERKN